MNPKGRASAKVRNRLLAALPAVDQRRILPTLQGRSLEQGIFLHHRGEPIRHVYFPAGGVCSLVIPMNDGAMVEIATVGNEGAVGLSGADRGGFAMETAMVQIPFESAQRMPVDAFRREMSLQGPFFETIAGYSQGLTAAVMQAAACNGLH